MYLNEQIVLAQDDGAYFMIVINVGVTGAKTVIIICFKIFSIDIKVVLLRQ